MARDTDKYCYFTVAVERSSLVFARLLQEASESGVPEASVILLRLRDYYQGVQSPPMPIVLPRQEETPQVIDTAVTSTNAEEVVLDDTTSADNVLAFLDELQYEDT